MKLLGVFLILGLMLGGMLFAVGMLWMIYVSFTTGFAVASIGQVVATITMIISLIYRLWEMFHNGKA